MFTLGGAVDTPASQKGYMMLIFDRFSSNALAQLFAARIRLSGLSAQVFADQSDSDKVDPFPLPLDAPIVLVERPGDAGGNGRSFLDACTEEVIIRSVSKFSGEFAGT